MATVSLVLIITGRCVLLTVCLLTVLTLFCSTSAELTDDSDVIEGAVGGRASQPSVTWIHHTLEASSFELITS